jgi:trk system potassium uptake protein TrkH
MNFRFVTRQLGLLLIGLSLAIAIIGALGLTPWLQSAAHGPWRSGAIGLLAAAAFGLILGATMMLAVRKEAAVLARREALLLVALGWLVGAAVAALPFWLWAHLQPQDAGQGHPFLSFINCYFEAMSGMTTTGATVLDDVASLPRSLLLWRATTHWLGGLGIVVLFVAVLPMLGVGGKKLFQVESPGPTKQGVRPRIVETARVLWMIYVGLTVTEILVLKWCGLGWFDAVCHTFATLATGGFGTSNASVAAFDSVAVDIVVIVFMILAGVNFGLYYQLARRRFSAVWRDPELRLYLAIILGASILVTLALLNEPIVSTRGGDPIDPSVAEAARHGIFQVVSIQTTTGFATADFNRWGFFASAVLVILMFVGGSAGSTGGGIKVIRILIAFKVMLAEVGRVFRPHLVKPVRVGRATVDPQMRQAVLVYVLGILFLSGLGALLLMWFEGPAKIDFTTAATASIATLNNIGPGLARVGATQNYGWFQPQSKLLMCLFMALGRLEVYAIIVLFLPGFWRRD